MGILLEDLDALVISVNVCLMFHLPFDNSSIANFCVFETRFVNKMGFFFLFFFILATELSLTMRGDGFIKVEDLLKLNFKTSANIQLRSHTVDEIREAVRRDNKQRFSLIDENGELLIRANQGHSITTVESEKLLKPILSPEEAPVCVHGSYKKNLESILSSGLKRMNRLHVHFSCGLPTDGEVVSGMRRNVNVLIFLDIKKALEDGIAFYISDNKVILTEGIDGVVPVDYFQKMESWPDRQPIPF